MAFTSGSCPFGFFDADPAFADEADNFVQFFRLKMGDPVVSSHTSASMLYACLEEACIEYGATLNTFQARSTLGAMLGQPTGSLEGLEQRYIKQNLELQRQMAEAYSDAGPLGGNTSYPLYSASIDLQIGVQKYNLNSILPSGTQGRAIIQQVFHFSPMSAYRFFGTTSAINYLHNQFNFESFTPETIFYLLPIWEDILRSMQFETSNRVRRSNYSYELHGNELTLFPVPAAGVRLHFTYRLAPQITASGPSGSISSDSFHGVSNISNLPYGNIPYSSLNSISRQWIRRFAFALAREVEGQIRSKYATVPIPNGDVQLNGSELINDARADQDRLREELRASLEELTYDKLSARQAEQSQALNEIWKNVPLPIYIGSFWPILFMIPYLLHDFGGYVS